MSEAEEKPVEAIPTPVAAPVAAGPSKEQLQLAMKAYRKRIKLMRLDDESRLGYGPMSNGRSAGVVAITPPDQFPDAVWQELARQGKLKHLGGGIYELVGS